MDNRSLSILKKINLNGAKDVTAEKRSERYFRILHFADTRF